MNDFIKNWRTAGGSLALVLGLLLAFGGTVVAQCETEPSLIGAAGVAGGSSFTVRFGFATNWNGLHQDRVEKATNPRNWVFFSPTLLQRAQQATDSQERLRSFEASAPRLISVQLNGNRGLTISFSGTLEKGETYLFNFGQSNDLVPKDCIGAPVVMKLQDSVASQQSPATQPGDTEQKPVRQIVLSTAKKRDDADIYIEGIAEGARKSKTAFTVDASFAKKFRFKRDEDDYYWKPFFNIKASTNPDADPDSLNFGVEFATPTKLLAENPIGLARVYFTEAAKIEADRDFENVNLVGDIRARFHVTKKLFQTERHNLVPFAGIEFGRNFKSPVAEIKGNAIARPLIGANLYVALYNFDRETYGYRRTISFETLYERRFPLTREIALDEDDDGNPIALRPSRAPKDYLKSSVTVDFAKYFGFKVSYEYGSLPPVFKFLDSKFSVGLVFKGAFQAK